jgi:hypothetical protein
MSDLGARCAAKGNEVADPIVLHGHAIPEATAAAVFHRFTKRKHSVNTAAAMSGAGSCD